MKTRRKTKTVYVGSVAVGGKNPIAVQSMTKTDTADVASTVKQIRTLEVSGCEIIRLAVPDMDAAKALGAIKQSTRIPMIADIHFDWRLALEALRQGIDGLRINPGKYRGEMESERGRCCCTGQGNSDTDRSECRLPR